MRPYHFAQKLIVDLTYKLKDQYMKVKLVAKVEQAKLRPGDELEVVGIYFREYTDFNRASKSNLIYICRFDGFVNELYAHLCELIDGTIPKEWIFYTTNNGKEFNYNNSGLQLHSIFAYPEMIQNKMHLVKLYQQEQIEYNKFLSYIKQKH